MNRDYRLAAAIAACFTFSAVHVFATPLMIAPEQLYDLRGQRTQLDAKVKELNESNKQISVSQADNSSAKETIKLQEAVSKKAKANLEKKQAYDRENPGEITEQLRVAEENNKQATRALKDTEEKRADTESKFNKLNTSAVRQYAEFKRLQKSYEGDVDRVVDHQLQENIRALQVSKVMEVSAQVSCGDESITACKERSKKSAELKASEQGSVVLVNSLTEVKNFKLTKEELRSEVRATLSDEKILSQNFIGDSGFETKISVKVERAISESLREQMAGAIRAEIYTMVGGRIDYAQVQNPSLLQELRADESILASKSALADHAVPGGAASKDAGDSSTPSSSVFRNQTLLIRGKSLSVTPVSYGSNISSSDFSVFTSMEIENVSGSDIWVGILSLRLGACKIGGFNDFTGVTFVNGDDSYADFKQVKNGSSEERRNHLTMLPAGSTTVLIAQSNACGRNGMISLSGKSAPFSADLVLDVKGKFQRLSAGIAEFPTAPKTLQ